MREGDGADSPTRARRRRAKRLAQTKLRTIHNLKIEHFMQKIFILWLCCAFVFCGQLVAQNIPAAPNPMTLLVDKADMLDEKQEKELLKTLKKHQKKTKQVFVVVTIESLEGAELEPYATQLFNTWGIGDKERNDGLLILVAKNERKMRIEVGRGLENRLTNDFCADVINKDMTPNFKKTLYFEGINIALTHLTLRATPAKK
jgi:uncharacterized protein